MQIIQHQIILRQQTRAIAPDLTPAKKEHSNELQALQQWRRWMREGDWSESVLYVRERAAEKMSEIKTAREREKVNEKKVRKREGLIKDCVPWRVFSSNSFSKIHERECFTDSIVAWWNGIDHNQVENRDRLEMQKSQVEGSGMDTNHTQNGDGLRVYENRKHDYWAWWG